MGIYFFFPGGGRGVELILKAAIAATTTVNVI